ncbi:MAG: hypothetical protein IT373_04600 [Polyangiaceae bacterium]|nr:hypothetical protein [Polyangiaceae bacterium]
MEGDRLVFTSVYLLKRGYCCNSGCRHCPYRGQALGVTPLVVRGLERPGDDDESR